MKTELPQVHRVERVDDIPVLLATLQRLKVDEILDRHFPSGHRWKGALTFGEVACVWIAFITSQGDHRLCQLQPWAQDNLHTLAACLGKTVRPLDFQDDRLADMLDHLALKQAKIPASAGLSNADQPGRILSVLLAEEQEEMAQCSLHHEAPLFLQGRSWRRGGSEHPDSDFNEPRFSNAILRAGGRRSADTDSTPASDR